jgi:hypothetical protein
MREDIFKSYILIVAIEADFVGSDKVDKNVFVREGESKFIRGNRPSNRDYLTFVSDHGLGSFDAIGARRKTSACEHRRLQKISSIREDHLLGLTICLETR